MPGEHLSIQTSFQSDCNRVNLFWQTIQGLLAHFLADEIQDFSNNCTQHLGDQEKRKLSFFSKDTLLIHRA